MLLFPNCKINIGLRVVSRRQDGYHNLETVFYPVHRLHDALEVLPQKQQTDMEPTAVQSRFSGLPIGGEAAGNLCTRAYHLLKQDFPHLPPIELCLHKAIPMGAGLGGGSADGAFMLRLLNEQFHLNLLPSQLLDYALQLGSDCPFFLINRPCYAEGRGEILQELPLALTGFSLLLIHPNLHVSTAQAFAGITPAYGTEELPELVSRPIGEWRDTVVNDFEVSVFKAHPLLQEIKNRLYTSGAVYAAMSGSGSTLYGIYPTAVLPQEQLYPGFSEFRVAL